MPEFDALPETFDPSAHEGTQDLEPISPGWYLAQMIENSVEYARNGNGTYLFTVFEILDGEYQGRKIYHNVTLQNSSAQAVEIGQRLLTDIYTAVGISGPTKDIRVMLYKPIKVRVGIKRDPDGIYPDRNNISRVQPPGYEPKRGRNPAPPTTPSTPAPPKSSPPSSTGPRGDAPWR